MYFIDPKLLGDVVYQAIPTLACVLPNDVLTSLTQALQTETSSRGKLVLSQLLENAEIAAQDRVPLCQDTGTVWVSLEIGSDIAVTGEVFSQVNDAVDRTNTTNNTPAFCDIHPHDEPGVARCHIMLKGGGSDNASRVVMLTPGAGKQAIVDEVLACVREKGPNACPPLIVGIGVGATFDKVAGLAKQALMRPLNEEAPDEQTAAFEAELKEAINALGVGPAGLGGNTTAFDVRVKTAPCHIAALPLAINMGCSAMRRVTVDLMPLIRAEADLGGAHV